MTYFKDVLRYESTESLVDDLTAEAGRGDRVAQQLRDISGIVNRKYRSIQIAMWALLVALLLCLGSALLG